MKDRPHRQAADQVAALCWRPGAGGGTGVELLLITARSTGQWIIPKGWPVPGQGLAASAAIEAWEEAGVTGRVAPDPVGRYRAVKQTGTTRRMVSLLAFALAVQAQSASFPEAGQRRQRWLPLDRAAGQVRNPDLARLLRGLAQDPARLFSAADRLS